MKIKNKENQLKTFSFTYYQNKLFIIFKIFHYIFLA